VRESSTAFFGVHLFSMHRPVTLRAAQANVNSGKPVIPTCLETTDVFQTIRSADRVAD